MRKARSSKKTSNSSKQETNKAGMTIVKINSPSRRSTRSRTTVAKSYKEEEDSEEEHEEYEEKRRVKFDKDEYDVSRPKGGFYGLLGQDWRSKDVMDP